MKQPFIIFASWLIEIAYWGYNIFSYIFSFVELKPLTRKTIFILTPTFTGPFLYRKAKKYLENKGFNVIIYNFSKEIKDIDTSAEKLKKIMDDARDLTIEKPFGPLGTFNNFEHNKPVTKLIDYIFISKNSHFKVAKYAVLSDSKDLKYPSDHLPVYVEMN